ncbi:MAG: class I SAM-dependent methyltransferase [Ruminococcaceae bacterium]|nr:class I SAM-dependent methyltransferase [Oscillospiraceae bacterium]
MHERFSRNRPPVMKKAVLTLNGMVCSLLPVSFRERQIKTAVSAAFDGRLCPEAESYNRLVSHHFSRIAADVLADLELAGKTVLDIGCGAGFLTGALLAAGADYVICVDCSQNMLSNCQDKVKRAGHVSACKFVPGEADSLPLPDASVDLVVSSMTLGLLTSPAAAVNEMVRLLKPGGTVSLATMGSRYLYELQNAAIRYTPLIHLLGRSYAVNPITSREAHQLFTAAELTEINIKHAYWQDAFHSPADAFDFAAAASARLWAANLSEKTAKSVSNRILQHFNSQKILKLTQDVVYLRAKKPAF